VHGMHAAATSKVENSAQGSSCKLKFVHEPGNTKGGSITVLLTSSLTSLGYSVLHIKTKNVSCYTAVSKPVKQEVIRTVILPRLVFPEGTETLVSHGITPANRTKPGPSFQP
jgi:hypothetical protein